jgi:hypothetical protein
VTFFQTLQKQFMELLFRETGKSFSHAMDEELFSEPGKLERLLQALCRGHPAKNFEILPVIRPGFYVHDSIVPLRARFVKVKYRLPENREAGNRVRVPSK